MPAPGPADDIFLEDALNQLAVYWHFDRINSEGRPILLAPIEIVCHYQQVTENFINRTSNQPEMSRSKVLSDRDLKERGVIWLPPGGGENLSTGEALAQLRTADPARAFENPGAYEIRRFDKIPDFDGEEFARIAYL